MKKDVPRRRTEIVSTHLEPQLKAALTRVAERDGRSLSNKLRQLAERAVCDEQGRLEPAQAVGDKRI